MSSSNNNKENDNPKAASEQCVTLRNGVQMPLIGLGKCVNKIPHPLPNPFFPLQAPPTPGATPTPRSCTPWRSAATA